MPRARGSTAGTRSGPRGNPAAWSRDKVNRLGFLTGIADAVCGLLVLFNAGRLLDVVVKVRREVRRADFVPSV